MFFSAGIQRKLKEKYAGSDKGVTGPDRFSGIWKTSVSDFLESRNILNVSKSKKINQGFQKQRR